MEKYSGIEIVRAKGGYLVNTIDANEGSHNPIHVSHRQYDQHVFETRKDALQFVTEGLV